MQRQKLKIDFDLKAHETVSFTYKAGEIDRNGVEVELSNIDLTGAYGVVNILFVDTGEKHTNLITIVDGKGTFIVPTASAGNYEFEVEIINSNGLTISANYLYTVLPSIGETSGGTPEEETTILMQIVSLMQQFSEQETQRETNEDERVVIDADRTKRFEAMLAEYNATVDRFNDAILGGSIPEVGDARGDFPLLGDRLDDVDVRIQANTDLANTKEKKNWFGSTFKRHIYNMGNGCLIKTNLFPKNLDMVTLKIYGNPYMQSTKGAYDCTYNIYSYSNGLINQSGIANGLNLPIKAFYFENTLCFWFKQSGSFQSFIIELTVTNQDRKNIEFTTHDVAMPTTGIENLVEINPAVSYTTANKPTLAEIGASASNHTHNYLPLTGGELSGALTVKGYLYSSSITTANKQVFGTSNAGVFLGNPLTPLKLESSVNPTVSIGSTVYQMYHTGNKPTKSDVGLPNVDNTADSAKNVLSATKLTTPRNIALTGDVTGSVNFDGSGNVSIATTVANAPSGDFLPLTGGTLTGNLNFAPEDGLSVIDFQNTGTNNDRGWIKHQNSSIDARMEFCVSDDATSGNDYFVFGSATANSNNLNAPIIQFAKIDRNGVTSSKFTGDLSGNANTASKLRYSNEVQIWCGSTILTTTGGSFRHTLCTSAQLNSWVGGSGQANIIIEVTNGDYNAHAKDLDGTANKGTDWLVSTSSSSGFLGGALRVNFRITRWS